MEEDRKNSSGELSEPEEDPEKIKSEKIRKNSRGELSEPEEDAEKIESEEIPQEEPEQLRCYAHSPLTVTVSGPDEPENARVIFKVDAGATKRPAPKTPLNVPPRTPARTPELGVRKDFKNDGPSPTAPIIESTLEEIKVVKQQVETAINGVKMDNTPKPRTPKLMAKAAALVTPSPRLTHDLSLDNEANERKALMVALLEVPDMDAKRNLTPSAMMLRTPGRKFSALELEGLKDKVRRDHLNTCRLLLKQTFPSGNEIRASEFKKALAQPAFLDELFGLFDHSEADWLKQDDWIDLLKSRLPKNLGLDFVELVESVAYILVGDYDVNLGIFRRIFASRGVLDKLFRLIDADKDELVSIGEIMDMITTITMPKKENMLTAENLALLEKLFREHMSRDSEIHLDDFKRILNSKNPFFAERVFSIFDKDGSGAISLTEFLEAMGRFATQDHDEKLHFLFQIYDVDGDGLIQRRELQAVLRACMDENGMNFSDEQLEDLTCALYEDADAGNEITYDALKSQLMKHEGLLENLSISIERWLVPPKPDAKAHTKMQRPYQLTMPYVKNNYAYLIFLFLFIFAPNIILGATRIYEFRNWNGFVIVARLCGQCLNYNCSFILILMLRHMLTFLRNHGFASILPLDQHIYLHKIVGWLILFFGMVHTVAHLANIEYLFVHTFNKPTQLTYAEWLFTTKPAGNLVGVKLNYGLKTAWANPTGCALVVILVVIVLCSLPCVRRSGNFEIFYWTHLLYVPFWIILILHCKNFWKWFVGPGVLYIIERLVRLIKMGSDAGRTNISSGILLPSKVTHLVVKRPPNFYFSCGDYVFVNIPRIAKYEWHPFTISSAPELEDSMWLHIRGVGQWTNRLYNYFSEEQAKLENMKRATVLPMEGLLKGLAIPARGGQRQQRPRSGFQNFKRKISQSFRPNRDSFMVAQDVPLVNGSGRNGGVINEAFLGPDGTSITLNGPNGSDGDVFLPSPAGVETAAQRRKTRFMSAPKKSIAARLSSSMGGSTTGVVPPSQRKVEKTKSMPDLEENMRRRNKKLMLREVGRANSEQVMDDQTLRRGLAQAAGAPSPYRSSQNRSVAHSFRYMRRKPTIVALEVPSDASGADMNSTGDHHHKPASLFVRGGSKDRRSLSANLVSALAPVAEDEEGSQGKGDFDVDNVAAGKEDIEEIDEGDEEDPTPGVDYPVGKALEIYIDGPYGAPSSHIFRAQHAVLIGTGIGVTPFASILQSIMHRYWNARQNCPNCRFTWCSNIPKSIMNLRKVDFFWINRDQRSFEWFVELLSQLEIEQAELGGAMERFLDMHMYITSALQKTDMKALGLQLALELLHQKEKRDLITGLKTRTMAGRPNWNKVFQQISEQNKGKVTVFYCGPPELARTLRVKCHEYGFAFRKESF